MKTTLNLNDQLLGRAKNEAARTGATLTGFVETALREKLMNDDRHRSPFTLELKTVRGHAPPNVDIADREALYDVLDRP